MLYFCSEATAFKILTILHKEIIPNRFQYHKLRDDHTIIEGEAEFLIEIVKKQNPTADLSMAKKFFEFFSTNMLCNLYLNKFHFGLNYYIFEHLIMYR